MNLASMMLVLTGTSYAMDTISAENLVKQEDSGISLLWGIADTTASVGRMFQYHIPADAFKGDIQSYKVS